MVTVHAIDDGDEYMMFFKKNAALFDFFCVNRVVVDDFFVRFFPSTTYVFDGPVLRCEERPVRALDEGHGGGGGADVHRGGAVAVAVAAALADAAAVGPAAALVAVGGPRVPVLALVVVAAPDVGGDAVGRGAADLLVAGLKEKVFLKKC